MIFSLAQPLLEGEERRTMLSFSRGLWRHQNFMLLWAGQTVSLFGTQITTLALPTIAILLLHVTPFEVGVLAAIPWVAYLGLGLFAGVTVDRMPRRIVMMIADIGRAVALGSIPLAFTLGVRSIYHLYLVAAIVGILNVFFEIAYHSYLPTLVEPGELIEGNAKLSLGDGAAQMGGPALAGFLIELLGAALAIITDAISYLLSALTLLRITARESKKETVRGTNVLAEMREGIKLVLRHPIIRILITVSSVQNIGSSIADTAILLFAYRTLHLTPGIVGLTFTLGSAGFVLGAVTASAITRKLGGGPTLVFSSLLGTLSYLVIPLGLLGAPILWIGLFRLFLGLHIPTYNVNTVSLRQTVIPAQLQGRVAATALTLAFGSLSLGFLLGGLLASTWGLVATIICGGIVFLIGSLPLLSRVIVSYKNPSSAVVSEATLQNQPL